MNLFKLNKQTGEYEDAQSPVLLWSYKAFLAEELAKPPQPQVTKPQTSVAEPVAPATSFVWHRLRKLSDKSSIPPWKHLERTGLANLNTPQSLLELSEEKALIRKALLKLRPREERIVRLRNGLGCEEHTLAAVAEKFSLTSETIRQIEAKAYRKMKHRSAVLHKHSFEMTVAA